MAQQTTKLTHAQQTVRRRLSRFATSVCQTRMIQAINQPGDSSGSLPSRSRFLHPDPTSVAAQLAYEVRSLLKNGSKQVTLANAGCDDVIRAVKRRFGCSAISARLIVDRAQMFLRVTGVEWRRSVRHPRCVRYVARSSRKRSGAAAPSSCSRTTKRLKAGGGGVDHMLASGAKAGGPSRRWKRLVPVVETTENQPARKHSVLDSSPCWPRSAFATSGAFGEPTIAPSSPPVAPLSPSPLESRRADSIEVEAINIPVLGGFSLTVPGQSTRRPSLGSQPRLSKIMNPHLPGWAARMALLIGPDKSDAMPLACASRRMARCLFYDALQLSAELRPITRALADVALWGDEEEALLQFIRGSYDLLSVLAPVKLRSSFGEVRRGELRNSLPVEIRLQNDSANVALILAEAEFDLAQARVKRMDCLLTRMATRVRALAGRFAETASWQPALGV